MRTFDFYYELGSPYSYLAATQLKGLEERTGAQATAIPIALGGVRKALGTNMPSQAQLAYMGKDVGRWARKYGVTMLLPSSFPARTLPALRACVAAEEVGKGREAMLALFAAHWTGDQDLGQLPLVKAALDQAGLNGAALVARVEAPEIKERLKAYTDRAVERGVFGVPMFFVGEKPYWGNDRLEFVEAALR